MKKKEYAEVIERPRICCLDLSEIEIEALKKNGVNIYNGTLGKQIRIPNKKKYDNRIVLLNYDFPSNLHEYDIIIINLSNSEIIDYNEEDNIRKNITGKSSTYLLSSYPQNIFNPRPLSSYLLKNELKKISNRTCLIVAFSSKDYICEYEPIKITEDYDERLNIEKYSIYSFLNFVPLSNEKIGKEIKILDTRDDLNSLLKKYIANTIYYQTYYHPTVYENNNQINDKNYVPLMKNMNNDIISYYKKDDNFRIFILPQISDKKNFLIDFLQKVAPSIFPELFPFSTQFSWKNDSEYWLPNHLQFLKENENVTSEFKKKLSLIEEKMLKNKSKYKFLHDLITETSSNLVNSVKKYFQWLEFDTVRNMDSLASENRLLEEDLQIEHPKGLLIVEVKGIGGTSTDSDCSQISKIKHRRCKERGKFDVFALYIVNHQRYLPPLKRQNPPFTEHQIQDAKNDERGLLTTWQLFNLYFDIKNEVITKIEAKDRLIEFGLVEFKPNDLLYIDEPKRFYENGLVSIINIQDIHLQAGENIFIEKNGKFEKAKIVSLMVNNNQVSEVDKGKIGIKLDKRIRKKTILWKKMKCK